jgi:Domain of unknown function (DUF6458)
MAGHPEPPTHRSNPVALDPHPNTSPQGEPTRSTPDRRLAGRPSLALASALLIAAGFVLRWAVTGSVAGVSVNSIGAVLIAIGIVGFVIALVTMRRRRRALPTATDHR